jgi:eukaryotic-like serine/threonine-protein kinase
VRTVVELAIGTLIGKRYLLRRHLGDGGMASVFDGEDTLLARRVAVKVLRGAHEQREDAERFLHEARALASLDAPHLVPLYDAGWHHGAPFLVMKLLAGRTLRDLLRETPVLPLPRVIAIISQLLKALGHIHRRGLVHRDVKPENVFVAHDDHVTLVDLGIAYDARRDEAVPGQPLVGTPQYMSPEQGKGEHGDLRSDLYAAGLLLFEAITGQCAITPVLLSQLPHDLTAVVMRALDPSPERRFASAIEMRSALLKLPRGVRLTPPLEPPTPPAAPDVDTEVGKGRSPT